MANDGNKTPDFSSDRLAVELVPHSSHWAAMAADEAVRLQDATGETFVVIHHIGSTAIPGIKAKPIIDLIPVATGLQALDAARGAIEALGYEWMGEFGLPGRRYCRMNDPVTGKRRFQLHCYAQNSPEIARHLAFRNYLRTHPLIAQDYEAQKIRAAALHPDDVLLYNGAKNDWIKATERDALKWAGHK